MAQEVKNVQIVDEKASLRITFELAGEESEYEIHVAVSEENGCFRELATIECKPGKGNFTIEEPLFCPAGIFRITAKSRKVEDIDGNVYHTVRIGKQVWFKENLKVSRYRNGDRIATNLSDTEWGKTEQGAFAFYNNLEGNSKTYGMLYNHYAVKDWRGLCPAGWYVPDDSDWTNLENFEGGKDYFSGERSPSGGLLKAISNAWESPNTGATNESKFSALPGGRRTSFGGFDGLGSSGFWWSSSQSINPWSLSLKSSNAHSFWTKQEKRNGFSVRCVRK